MKAVEQRKSLRFQPADGRVRLVTEDGPVRPPPPREAEHAYPVTNVSTSGMAFRAPRALKPGEIRLLSFSARHLSQPMRVRSRVVWCSPAAPFNGKEFHVGVRFEGLAPRDRTLLERLPGRVDLARIPIDPALARHIPPALARRRRVVPFFLDEEYLHVAMADPSDTAALEAIQRHARRPVKVYQAEEQAVTNCVALLYGSAGAPARPKEDGRAVSFLDDLLRAALMRGASDIHLEPEPPRRVRFRVDGRLTMGPAVDEALYRALVSRVKVLAGLDIAEKRESQDGRMSWSAQGFDPVDLRVATIPSIHGEHVTLRLLGGREGPKELSDLGMAPEDLETFRRAITAPFGMILLTGPTGSGKSTTLYAALETIKQPEMHILSVEDPVERRITGITQVQVDYADKVGFASALRSLLRHDPDVIMIGEIRDEITLDTALKSALTGHLVFSTLHTNDSTSAPTRLVHMGAPPYLAAATLRLVGAQRLVRRLCPACARPADLDPFSARALGLEAGLPVRAPGGCPACNGTGYAGRTGLFEFLVVTERIQELIVKNGSAGAIRSAALEEGLRTLQEDGAAKVRAGITDPAEVIRAAAGTIELLGGGA